MGSVACISIGVAIAIGAAHAAPPDLDWIREHWEKPDNFDLPDSIVLRWTELEYPQGTAADLERYRGTIDGKPDHPLRDQAETLARRLASGADRREWTLWYQDSDRFRLACSYSEGWLPISYNDTAVNGDLAWRITDRGLHLLDMRDLPKGEYPRRTLETLRIKLAYCIWPGFGAGPLGRRPISISGSSERWVCSVKTADGLRRFRLIGTGSDLAGSPTAHVVRQDVVTAEKPEFVGTSTVYDEREFNDFLGREIATKYTYLDKNGSPIYGVEIEELRELIPGELGPLLVEPDANSADPVRGRLAFNSIYDSRSGSSTVRTGLEPDAPPEPSRENSASASPWRMTLIAGILGLFVYLAFRVKQKGASNA